MTLPEPYYQDDYCTIYHADCRDILPDLPPVDLVLTDPPYGKKYARGKNGWGVCDNRPTISDVEWDVKPSADDFCKIVNASKNQIVFGGNYFTDLLPPTNGWIFWDKVGTTTNKSVFADGELAWSSYNKVLKKYTFRVMGFINDSADRRVHPTQKPTELFKMIIQDYTDAEQTILDPFMGSGTTLRAAKDLQRKAIGIEINEKYCEIAAKRLAQEVLDL